MTAPGSTSPFAVTADLVVRWRPLSAAEQSRATVLLGDASTVMRAYIRNLDARIASGDVPAGAAVMVACRMVRRAMEQRALALGKSQIGPWAGEFSNPESYLFILPEEFRILGRSTNKSPLYEFDLPPLVDPLRQGPFGYRP